MRISNSTSQTGVKWHIAVKNDYSWKDGAYKPRCGQDKRTYDVEQTKTVTEEEFQELVDKGEVCEKCLRLFE